MFKHKWVVEVEYNRESDNTPQSERLYVTAYTAKEAARDVERHFRGDMNKIGPLIVGVHLDRFRLYETR